MVDKINMSLDDIIKSSKNQKQIGIGRHGSGGARWGSDVHGGRAGAGARREQTSGSGGGGGAVLKGLNRGGGIHKAKFARGDMNNAWKHDMYEGLIRGAMLNAKLLVSNLYYGVSDSDIQKLFAMFGPLITAGVHYDRAGRSLGTADVVFERRSDALEAMRRFNGLPLDGRPINIQLATSDISELTRFGRINTGGIPVRGRQGEFPPRRGAPTGPRRGGLALTVEELDAELDAYMNDGKV